MTWPEKSLSSSQWHDYQLLIGQRVQGQPVAYLVGQQGFWDLQLEVSTDTLIPRSESELLVELIPEKVNGLNTDILDLGTGTGPLRLPLPIVVVKAKSLVSILSKLLSNSRNATHGAMALLIVILFSVTGFSHYPSSNTT